jgi:hypothetical protein
LRIPRYLANQLLAGGQIHRLRPHIPWRKKKRTPSNRQQSLDVHGKTLPNAPSSRFTVRLHDHDSQYSFSGIVAFLAAHGKLSPRTSM